MYRNCGLISNSLKLLPCLFMLFAPSYRLSWLSPHKHGTFLTPAHIQTYQCCWEECTWNLSDSEDNYDYKFSKKNTESRWTPADTLCIFRQVTQPSSTYSSLALPAHWLVVMHDMTRVLPLWSTVIWCERPRSDTSQSFAIHTGLMFISSCQTFPYPLFSLCFLLFWVYKYVLLYYCTLRMCPQTILFDLSLKI